MSKFAKATMVFACLAIVASCGSDSDSDEPGADVSASSLINLAFTDLGPSCGQSPASYVSGDEAAAYIACTYSPGHETKVYARSPKGTGDLWLLCHRGEGTYRMTLGDSPVTAVTLPPVSNPDGRHEQWQWQINDWLFCVEVVDDTHFFVAADPVDVLTAICRHGVELGAFDGGCDAQLQL